MNELIEPVKLSYMTVVISLDLIVLVSWSNIAFFGCLIYNKV